jgi:uncharacterized membrane protein YsdA (DUF1294 family)
MKYLLLYILIVNLYSFYLMYKDKSCALKHLWRVSEAKLFTVAFLLGSFGIYAGMYIFRHKTKHKKFVYLIPLLLLLQLYFIITLYLYLK